MQATYREVPIADNVIRVALVQLRSPFAGPRPDLKLLDLETIGPPRFVWSDKIAIARRVAAANESLKFLKTFRPHLIAFPEYAVPKECHSHLQEYADDCDCILVPGSYYDDDTNSIRYQNNVSRIFIPRQESVYVIKHDRFGDEERVLSKERPAPNIAHLTWRSSIGSPMGVSVFICRDYLRPYDPNHTSLLDWDRPGLNLVIMHAAQTELFDAQAGLDVRRLRGKGRFVALCNCAGITNETRFRGSALLGPTKDSRRKEGDLIERLPSELEGVLTAELDLSKVQLDEIRPDKTEHDPLGTVRRYHLLQDDKHHVLFDPIGDPTPVERGVWHPALLEALGRNITLVLRKSRRYREVANTLRDPSNNKIRFVSVSGLLGDQDFVFRLYEDAGGRLPLLGTPYSSLPRSEQDRLFEEEPHKYVVEPKYIFKYRTNIIPPETALWEAKRREIDQRLPSRANRRKRRQLLSALCRLARNWNDREVGNEVRDQVKTFFLPQTEIVPSLRSNGGTSLRRRYILVSLSNGALQNTSSFERHVVRNWLLSVPEVRSLYGIITKGGSTQFHYWIDIIADPYRADAILLELQRRCEDERIHIGTRSIDVMEHLLHESVEGIENTDFGEETCRFMQEVAGVELDTAVMLPNDEFIFDWTRAWDYQTASIDPTLIPDGRDKVTNFYRCFFSCNFAAQPSARLSLLRETASAWLILYQDLETACQDLLKYWSKAASKEELDEHLKTHFGPTKAAGLAEVRSDWVRLLVEYMYVSTPELIFPDIGDMRGLRRLLMDVVRGFRNDITHEGDPRKRDALYILGMELNIRKAKASRVTEATRVITELLSAIRLLLHQKNPDGSE